jgi:hypothetical protein
VCVSVNMCECVSVRVRVYEGELTAAFLASRFATASGSFGSMGSSYVTSGGRERVSERVKVMFVGWCEKVDSQPQALQGLLRDPPPATPARGLGRCSAAAAGCAPLHSGREKACLCECAFVAQALVCLFACLHTRSLKKFVSSLTPRRCDTFTVHSPSSRWLPSFSWSYTVT